MPKRRANGEGNIRKRKDGRWEGRYTAGYDPESGKRIIKNVLGKTQAEVKEKLKTAISESQRLDVSKAGTYTVSSWVKTWYEVYAEPRIRPNTKAYYTNYIENHIVPGIGNISLDKLTTIQIQRFYNNLQKTGRVQRKNFPELRDKSLSPRVVRGVHTLLHNCLEQAVAERLILANPAQGCKLPQLEKKEMKILPQEKIGMYLAEAERRGLLAAFYLELTTGLRRGELLALQWTDLDVESKTLSITKQVNRINGELVVSLLPFLKPIQLRRFYPDEKIETYQDAVQAVMRHSPVDTSKRNVLVCHQFITGAETSDSEEKTVGGLDNIDAAVFSDFDYVALGHIHKPQQCARETLRYAGSLMKYSFSEVNQKKSVTVVEMGCL